MPELWSGGVQQSDHTGLAAGQLILYGGAQKPGTAWASAVEANGAATIRTTARTPAIRRDMGRLLAGRVDVTASRSRGSCPWSDRRRSSARGACDPRRAAGTG